MLVYFFHFIIYKNVNQISFICQDKLSQRKEVLKFQSISAKYFNVKTLIKSMFVTICNTYCIIHCKIQMIFMINLQKLITVYDSVM